MLLRTDELTRVRYRIVGFDRVNFVGDVADAIPQGDTCRISSLCFEADGLQAIGLLTIQWQSQPQLVIIRQRLESVRGVVRVEQLN